MGSGVDGNDGVHECMGSGVDGRDGVVRRIDR